MQTSTQRPALLTDRFSYRLLRSLHARAVTAPRLGQNLFLPRHFQFIIHCPLCRSVLQSQASWLDHTRTETWAEMKWTQLSAQQPRHFYPCLSKICFMIILPTMFRSYSSSVSSRLPEKKFPLCMLHFRPVVSWRIMIIVPNIYYLL